METYNQFINSILNSRGRFACGDEYHERHHIMPRCMYGTDDEDNLIDLYAHEHFIAHKLLAEENPENSKLVYAWWMMANVQSGNQQRVVSPEEYEAAKKTFAQVHSAAVSEALKGHAVSDEARAKISQNHADVSAEKNPMYGKRHTDEAKFKVSKANKGKRSVRRNCNPVFCVELDVIFDDATDAAQKLNLDSSCILKCCRGERKMCGGYQWQFVVQENNLENNI